MPQNYGRQGRMRFSLSGYLKKYLVPETLEYYKKLHVTFDPCLQAHAKSDYTMRKTEYYN